MCWHSQKYFEQKQKVEQIKAGTEIDETGTEFSKKKRQNLDDFSISWSFKTKIHLNLP